MMRPKFNPNCCSVDWGSSPSDQHTHPKSNIPAIIHKVSCMFTHKFTSHPVLLNLIRLFPPNIDLERLEKLKRHECVVLKSILNFIIIIIIMYGLKTPEVFGISIKLGFF